MGTDQIAEMTTIIMITMNSTGERKEDKAGPPPQMLKEAGRPRSLEGSDPSWTFFSHRGAGTMSSTTSESQANWLTAAQSGE